MRAGRLVRAGLQPEMVVLRADRPLAALPVRQPRGAPVALRPEPAATVRRLPGAGARRTGGRAVARDRPVPDAPGTDLRVDPARVTTCAAARRRRRDVGKVGAAARTAAADLGTHALVRALLIVRAAVPAPRVRRGGAPSGRGRAVPRALAPARTGLPARVVMTVPRVVAVRSVREAAVVRTAVLRVAVPRVRCRTGPSEVPGQVVRSVPELEAARIVRSGRTVRSGVRAPVVRRVVPGRSVRCGRTVRSGGRAAVVRTGRPAVRAQSGRPRRTARSAARALVPTDLRGLVVLSAVARVPANVTRRRQADVRRRTGAPGRVVRQAATAGARRSRPGRTTPVARSDAS